MAAQSDVTLKQLKRAGVITLNRPKAFNALTTKMIAQMQDGLEEWQTNEDISHVIIEAVPGRAFCAGGDIRAIYDLGRAKDPEAQQFFRMEYQLNTTIKNYPKPFIALMDGITMGGGVGLSVHGALRIATENLMLAMPETGIGLFPDIGASYVLPRCPGEIGMYLGLTGARLKASDALYAGLIDHYVPADKLADLKQVLCDSAHPAVSVIDFTEDPGTPPLEAHRDDIDSLFAGDTLEQILAQLAGHDSDWARKTLEMLGGKSPTSLKITFHQLREGAKLSFRECMLMEFRMASRVLQGHDLYEGVRAVVIDKDMQPKWQPDALAQVADQDVAAYFAPLEQDLII